MDLRFWFDWGRNQKIIFWVTWLFFYYNAVLGLDADMVALAIGIALVVDALTDPWVGIWSDRVRTKWGAGIPLCT